MIKGTTKKTLKKRYKQKNLLLKSEEDFLN